MLSRRRLHLAITLRVTNLTEECRYSAVRLKLSHDATEVCFEGTVIDVQIEVRRA